MKKAANCESCIHYIYDEYYGTYACEADLDEDEMGRFLTYAVSECSYFQLDDEYQIVRKQN